MTAGTVVITGGIIAAVILLTIVAVLCCCRLQYYCCKSDGSEEEKEEQEEEKKSDFIKPLPSPAHHSNPPCFPRPPSPQSPSRFMTLPSPLSVLSFPEHLSPEQLLTTAKLHKPNGPAICRHYSPVLTPATIPSYMFCASCSGLLPFYLPREQSVRNGGGRVSYRSLEEQEIDLPMDISSFNKHNLIRSVTMSEVVTHQSISTDV
ncbi:protein FAM163B isoform 1-T3 [Clarias gariepinus]